VSLVGIRGKPYVDLSPHVDTSCFPELDREITSALCRVESSYTGATLKWMGVVAPWAMEDGYADAMHVIERLDAREREDFVALGDGDDDATEFGDETDHPFTFAQIRWLSFRHGVYFPWKVCYHLLENDRWEDKHSGEDKDFTDEARRMFPRTIAFIEELPFREIGRCVLFGIEANDHAPAHRDSEPGKALSIAQSISFDPRGDKGLFLESADRDEKVVVTSPIYWFNDADYHGVDPAPRFRYSIRVDGVFDPAFVKRVLP